MDPLAGTQPRELSRGPNSKFEPDWGIDQSPCSEEYRGALEYCFNIYQELERMRNHLGLKCVQFGDKFKIFLSNDIVLKTKSFQYDSVIDSKTLTKFQNHDIEHIFCGLYNKFRKKQSAYVLNLLDILGDLRSNYGAVSTQTVCDMLSNNEKNGGGYDTEYVQKHRAVYENFIPRCKELHTWILNSSDEFIRIQSIIKIFSSLPEIGRVRSPQRASRREKDLSSRRVSAHPL